MIIYVFWTGRYWLELKYVSWKIVYISSYYTIKYAYYKVCYKTFVSFLRFTQDLKGCVAPSHRIVLMRFHISCKCNLSRLMIESEVPADYKEKNVQPSFVTRLYCYCAGILFFCGISLFNLFVFCNGSNDPADGSVIAQRCALLKAYENMWIWSAIIMNAP